MFEGTWLRDFVGVAVVGRRCRGVQRLPSSRAISVEWFVYAGCFPEPRPNHSFKAYAVPILPPSSTEKVPLLLSCFWVEAVCEPEIVHLLENVPRDIGEEEVEPVMHDSDDGECEQVPDECQEVGDGECEVPVSEERAEGDDVVEGQIEVECDVGESERDDVVEGQIEVECDVGESERDDVVEVQIEVECDVGECERDDVVGGEIEVECDVGESERDDVVGGQIEVECDMGESKRDDVDVRSWSCSGEDANVDCNVDVPSMDDLVDCDIQEEVGHGVGNWFGEIEVDVQDDEPSRTRISNSDVEDAVVFCTL
ncbi:hypothetical protein LR48_Vigan08g081700 [Vigna angularis]|uniref:Uncharacterized protein n=1 Tax=Phaseolus angularis TaxID=3914 RepID=A0A0L9V4L9_PHAAN|nr:hypothetical protein LR48_Vigan08g081700 [Vigna angularis]